MTTNGTTKRDAFIAELAQLARELIPTIGDDYRASDDPADDEPGMQVTIGANAEGWNYQTGDTSYTGGAYGYANWGIGYLYRDTDPDEFARLLVEDLESEADSDEDARFFYEDEEGEE